MISKVLS